MGHARDITHFKLPPPAFMRSVVTNAVEVVRLRGELEASNGRVESALKELEESRACVAKKTREEACLREDGSALRARVQELEGDMGRLKYS